MYDDTATVDEFNVYCSYLDLSISRQYPVELCNQKDSASSYILNTG